MPSSCPLALSVTGLSRLSGTCPAVTQAHACR